MTVITLFDEAAAIARGHVTVPPAESLPIALAVGRTLAGPAIAKVDMPPFDRAMMDGYAVHSTDTAVNPCTLSVIDNLAAGTLPTTPVERGQAARIMTGAPMPAGADAVVRIEWCEASADQVRVLRPVQAGESVQLRGEDGLRGHTLIPAGTRLTGKHITVLQTFGVAEASVFVRPKVTILATGSELVADVRTPLSAGQIYASNHLYLASALEEDGYDVIGIRFVADSPDVLASELANALAASDIVLTTGGASVGDYDYMPQVMRQCGVLMAVEHILMRPGSPLCIGRKEKTAVFALSGNPAACFSQFESVVRPALQSSPGFDSPAFSASAKLLHSVNLKPIKHVRILRGQAYIDSGCVYVDVRLAQSSAITTSLIQSNCLVRLDESELAVGAVVPLRWLNLP